MGCLGKEFLCSMKPFVGYPKIYGFCIFNNVQIIDLKTRNLIAACVGDICVSNCSIPNKMYYSI